MSDRVLRAIELLKAGKSSKEAKEILMAEFNCPSSSARGVLSRARKILRAEGAEAPSPDEKPKIEFQGVQTKQNHFWNKADDLLIVWLPATKHHTVILKGADVREAKRMYSRWEESGPEESINQTAQHFGWSREFFEQLKKELGWTHDQDPFTRPELEDKEVDELYQDLTMMKRQQLERKRNVENWQETVDDALRWRQFTEQTLDPMFSRILELRGEVGMARPTPINEPDSASDLLAVLAPFDAHVDNLGYKGEGFEELRSALLKGFEATIRRLHRLAGNERMGVDLALGSDWWNIDRDDVKTAAGTPQDNALLPNDGLVKGLDLKVELIQMASELGDVHIRITPGNHDFRTCTAAWWALNRIYARRQHYSVEDNFDPFQYRLFGTSLLGWHHGNLKGGKKAKNVDYFKMMVNDARDLWSQSTFAYQFIGHLHHQYTEDTGGLVIIQQPSPSHTDRWHRQNAYGNASKGQAAHVIHRTQGMVASTFDWIE